MSCYATDMKAMDTLYMYARMFYTTVLGQCFSTQFHYMIHTKTWKCDTKVTLTNGWGYHWELAETSPILVAAKNIVENLESKTLTEHGI